MRSSLGQIGDVQNVGKEKRGEDNQESASRLYILSAEIEKILPSPFLSFPNFP